jgi:hypothetical protein
MNELINYRSLQQQHVLIAHPGHPLQRLVLTLVEPLLKRRYEPAHAVLLVPDASHLKLVQLWIQDELGIVIELAALDSPELSDGRGQTVEVVDVHLVRTLLSHILDQVLQVAGMHPHYHVSLVQLPLGTDHSHHLALPLLDLLQEVHISQLLRLVRLQLVVRDQQEVELLVAV